MAMQIGGKILDNVSTLANRRVSNVQTLTQTVMNNFQSTMATRRDFLQSLGAGGLLNATGGGLLSRIKGQVGSLLMQTAMPGYVQVPGYPATLQGVKVIGVNSPVTVEPRAPFLTRLPVQSV